MKQGLWSPLMLATLADEPFSRDGWYFEPKLDGIRCLAQRDGDEVSLLSRNALDLSHGFGSVIPALLRQKPRSFAVDGEIVALRDGVSSFEQLQQRSGALYFYLFDVLMLEGRDVRGLPLRERKALLESSFVFKDPLRLSEHVENDGANLFDEACRKGWEGIIAKDAAAPYAGRRSKAWLKFKCVAAQELVIGGWTEPAGSREEFGALLVGYYDGDTLRFAGKVGTGFDRETLRLVSQKLKPLETDASPFEQDGVPKLRVHWVKPRLVAQIAFHEWTSGGRLRQPRFQGLREDKKALDVVREKKTRA